MRKPNFKCKDIKDKQNGMTIICKNDETFFKG